MISLASTGIGAHYSTRTLSTGTGVLNTWQANSGLTEILRQNLHVEVEGSGGIDRAAIQGTCDDHTVLTGGEASETPIGKSERFFRGSTGLGRRMRHQASPPQRMLLREGRKTNEHTTESVGPTDWTIMLYIAADGVLGELRRGVTQATE